MIEFFVPGIPRPQGSKRAFKTKNGNIAMVEASKGLKPWRENVSVAAYNAKVQAGVDIFGYGSYEVDMVFAFARPASHLKANGGLRIGKPRFHSGKPDFDKLERAVCDAITGVLISDDSKIVCSRTAKAYTREAPGLFVSVRQIVEFPQWGKELMARLHKGGGPTLFEVLTKDTDGNGTD